MPVRSSLVLFLLPALVLGQEPKIHWRDIAKKHLQPAQINVLADQKFVVGDRTYKQVFTPYLGSDLPVFITSDSVLNAFHVLLEESVYRMERTNAARLPAFLEHTASRLDEAVRGLPAAPAELAAAKRRAQIFLGTAVGLSKGEPFAFDESTAESIRAETARVISAQGTSKPTWLGAADPGFVALDYSRFRPRGFYTRSAELQRYFRAVSWMQAIPFRIDKDEELLAVVILSRAAVVPEGPKFDAVRRGRAALDSLGEFLGSGDDWGLEMIDRYRSDLDAARWTGRGEKAMLLWFRDELTKRATGDQRPQINDQLAFLPDDPSAAAEISIRVAPAYRLPDAVLFQRTSDPRDRKRDLPSGLDVAAALGSPHARRELRDAGEIELLNRIDKNKSLFRTRQDEEDEYARASDTSSLHKQYLACLSNLLSAPEPDWPAFMKSEAWQAKTCQTALGGWAQMRHTWVLQAKLQITWMSVGPRPTGFVEPVPEFYRRLGALCARFQKTLDRAGAFEGDQRAADGAISFDREMQSVKVYRIEQLLALLEKVDVGKWSAEALRKSADKDLIRSLAKELDQKDPDRLERPEQFDAWMAALRKKRDQNARDLEADVVLGPRWRALRECCLRLELLSHKQLRGRDFTGDEKTFLGRYGRWLGWLMFYDGNSYGTPRDDAPRIVDVSARGGRFLEVGIGRPQATYVLYPWHGEDVLCKGAVLPYFEFSHGERLTDADWRKSLDHPGSPMPPSWTKVLTHGAAR